MTTSDLTRQAYGSPALNGEADRMASQRKRERISARIERQARRRALIRRAVVNVDRAGHGRGGRDHRLDHGPL